MTYTIVTYTHIVPYVRQSWLARLLRWPRFVVVLTAPGNVLLCNPAVAKQLTDYLDRRGLKYDLQKPQLQVLPGGRQ